MTNPDLDVLDSAQVVRVDDGSFAVQGDLVFATALRLRRQGEDLLPGLNNQVVVDLGQVGRVGSVGLSVLLCWMRTAARLGKTLKFVNMPDSLIDVSRVSGADSLISQAS